MILKKLKFDYFTETELTLWAVSAVLVITSFLVFDRENHLTLIASLTGVTALIFNAKGNPFGQFLMVIFSILYGIISFTFLYYGEMITYMGMTAPMAVFALVSWLRNPYNGRRAEVEINRLSRKELIFIFAMSAIATVVFYFILKFFNTANLIPSTLSVTTTFLAVCLTFRRSAFFAAAYAVNDAVLIVLWIMAALSNLSYLSVVVCFFIFFINDIYCFVNWSKIQKRQEANR